ncbi:prepilin peptidase [Methylobacter sp. BlB1]|jgi:prepilin peptidase CpaA|uniref:prepilin peptidase n=1 Tax=Methylobacter sp. BlB1 TaxID=2785914 RepID=UPI001E52CC4A|nr:prepilin peptidase [Methylobacter sp. BlB1]
MTVPIQYWIIGSWAVACGGYDMAFRRLPNVLTLGAHGGALAMLAVTGQGWLGASPSSCFAAWVLALVLTVPAWVLRRLGAGDAKLLAAMGLLGGMEAMLVAYAVAGLLVGGTAIIWILAYRWMPLLAPQLASIGIDAPAIPEPKGRILPFGLGLAIGFVVALVLLAARISVLPFQFD